MIHPDLPKRPCALTTLSRVGIYGPQIGKAPHGPGSAEPPGRCHPSGPFWRLPICLRVRAGNLGAPSDRVNGPLVASGPFAFFSHLDVADPICFRASRPARCPRRAE